MRNIWQSLFFAFVFNALAVPIAAGVFYLAIGLLLNPMIASAAMSLSSGWSSTQLQASWRAICLSV